MEQISHDQLMIYTVYFSPKDYPGEYVVRKWFCDSGDPIPEKEIFFRGKTFSECENLLGYEMGMIKLDRDPDDDPVIVCTFI